MIEKIAYGINILQSTLSLVDKVYKLLEFATPEGRTLEFSYPAQEMEISMLLSIPNGPKRWVRNKIHFNFSEIKSISLKNLSQFTDTQAITLTEQGYYLDTKRLGDGEKFLLTIKRDVPASLFRELVSVQNSDTPMNYEDGIEEYWLSAALKKRNILDIAYKGGFNIYGFENNAKISIHNSIGTTIPRTFINRLITITKFIKETNREQILKISHERLKQQKITKKHEDDRKIIMDLRSSFCTSNAFLKFIKIDKPFIFKDAIPGQNYYEMIPFDVFPKVMDVVATANINFDNPAAEGKLYFKRITFEEEIKNFFEEHGYLK